MKQRTLILLISVGAVPAVLAPVAALSQMAPPSLGTPSEGQELAQKLCSNCHATDYLGQEISRLPVPSFLSIAKNPRTTPERLAAAIILPHPEMPGISLSRAELRAVITYIMSLKPSP